MIGVFEDLGIALACVVGLWVYLVGAMAVWRFEHVKYSKSQRREERAWFGAFAGTLAILVVIGLMWFFASRTQLWGHHNGHWSNMAYFAVFASVVGGIGFLFAAGGLLVVAVENSYVNADLTWVRSLLWPLLVPAYLFVKTRLAQGVVIGTLKTATKAADIPLRPFFAEIEKQKALNKPKEDLEKPLDPIIPKDYTPPRWPGE